RGIEELYRWLGVADRPRSTDVLDLIDQCVANPPSQKARELVTKTLGALGKAWDRLPDNEKTQYLTLKTKAWLPAEKDSTSWYKPNQLYAPYNKSFFESQAKFLDAPIGVQQAITQLLEFLGVNRAPKPYQVVRHLLKCVEDNIEPPKGIYDWLNNNAQASDLAQLKDKPCLRLEGEYLRPDQVFWGQHPFGRFRVALGTEFQKYQMLLKTLGIKQTPDYRDAIEVLKEVASEVGNSLLKPEDKEVVLQCWVMLSEALQRGELDAGSIQAELHDTKCVPNLQEQLYPLSWMFFEDRPGLAEKFGDWLSKNTIPRPERAWLAMQAAGVKPISEAVTGEIVEAVNAWEDSWLRQRVTERMLLIKRICEGMNSTGTKDAEAIPPDNVRFLRAVELKVRWHLQAFGRNLATEPEPELAHLDRAKKAVYFTIRENDVPWAAIARELTQAITPGAEIRSISPGIKTVLEANDYENAMRQLSDLGIAAIQELPSGGSTARVADGFEERSMLGEDLGGQEPVSQDGRDFQLEDTFPKGESDEEQELEHARGTEGPSDVLAEETAPFAKKLYEAQTHAPSRAYEIPVWLPGGGPKTQESARIHTARSIQSGGEGSHLPKTVMRWQPTLAAKALAEEFRRMVHGDYAKRCQICSRTFKAKSGEQQVFIIHLVPPSKDPRTNHYGDLVSLCGWHYALVQHGQWAFIDPETDEPVKEWKRLQKLLLSASQKTDDSGNLYVGIPVRFWNVYQDWRPEPVTVDEEIRYSLPHWEYLRALLLSGGGTE
ncbi:MAG: hypothetical protein ACTSVD_02245, partial [Candidatus Thorarchaeota archaeon]